jgi:hypothetical protein
MQFAAKIVFILGSAHHQAHGRAVATFLCALFAGRHGVIAIARLDLETFVFGSDFHFPE